MFLSVYQLDKNESESSRTNDEWRISCRFHQPGAPSRKPALEASSGTGMYRTSCCFRGRWNTILPGMQLCDYEYIHEHIGVIVFRQEFGKLGETRSLIPRQVL